MTYKHEELTKEIINSAYAVHNTLGYGFGIGLGRFLGIRDVKTNYTTVDSSFSSTRRPCEKLF